jgi:hypothetical protein
LNFSDGETLHRRAHIDRRMIALYSEIAESKTFSICCSKGPNGKATEPMAAEIIRIGEQQTKADEDQIEPEFQQTQHTFSFTISRISPSEASLDISDNNAVMHEI